MTDRQNKSIDVNMHNEICDLTKKVQKLEQQLAIAVEALKIVYGKTDNTRLDDFEVIRKALAKIEELNK